MKRFLVCLSAAAVFAALCGAEPPLPLADGCLRLNRSGYTAGYSEALRLPVWTQYRLTGGMLKPPRAKRSGRFRRDYGAPGCAMPEDYRNSGYDRGHLVPAADMAYSRKTMEDSFLMGNIAPQRPSFNRGAWKRLEKQVRKFAETEQEICVVTGPVPPDENAPAGPGGIKVPEAYYKVVYDLTPPEKMIAFIVPQNGGGAPREYAVTVSEAEAATGLEFFAGAENCETYKKTVSVSDWQWCGQKTKKTE